MSLASLFRILFFIALAVSLHLFLAQGLNSGISIPHIDKVAHFIVFFGLSLLFDLGFSQSKSRALLLALFYGIAVEWLQSFIPGRQASIPDIIFDMLGCACYYYVAQTWLRTFIQKQMHSQS